MNEELTELVRTLRRLAREAYQSSANTSRQDYALQYLGIGDAFTQSAYMLDKALKGESLAAKTELDRSKQHA